MHSPYKQLRLLYEYSLEVAPAEKLQQRFSVAGKVRYIGRRSL